jgi:hypothetical protein
MIRPRDVLHSNVFKILGHIDSVEDMMFYRYPRWELIDDGKVPWRDFNWQFGRPDGNLGEEELHPLTRFCGATDRYNCRHPSDDDDQDRDKKHSSARGLLSRVSNCLEARSKSQDNQRERGNISSWYRGESSRVHSWGARQDPITGCQGSTKEVMRDIGKAQQHFNNADLWKTDVGAGD